MASITSAAQQGDLLAKAIADAIHRATEEAIEAAIAGVADKVRERLLAETGAIAGRVLEHFEMSRNAHILRIEVNLAPEQQGRV